MRKFLYLLCFLALSSCLGDDTSSYPTYDGVVMHNNTITSNKLVFDPVNIAVRFSYLMKEAVVFDSILTVTITYNNETKTVKNLLFGGENDSTIEKIEDGYAITYHEGYSLSGDRERFGTFFITGTASTLFESGAEWKVTFADDSDSKYPKPYMVLSNGDAYYGDNSYAQIDGGLSDFMATSYSYAEKVNATTNNTPASWKSQMYIDFEGSDPRVSDISSSIEFYYENKGNLLDNEDYYTQTTDTDLIYIAECSKINYIDGKITTQNYSIDGGYGTTSYVVVTRERESSLTCSYSTYVTYNGFAEYW